MGPKSVQKRRAEDREVLGGAWETVHSEEINTTTAMKSSKLIRPRHGAPWWI